MNAPVNCMSAIEQSRLTNAVELPILDSMFSPDDSPETVLKLLFDIQSYHQRRNFSHLERFGEPDPWSDKILPSLAGAIESAKQIIEDSR